MVSGCQELSSFAASARVKRPRNICDDEIEDYDSDEQYTSDESENECTNGLSGDTDDSITENEELHDKRREDRTIICQFTAPDNELIHAVAPNIRTDSSSVDCFTLMFTN
jgi:hypothetical protein